MLDPKVKAQADQSIATLRDVIPRMWWALYQGSLAQGFDETQAFSLVQTYILAQNHSGSRPNDLRGPEREKE